MIDGMEVVASQTRNEIGIGRVVLEAGLHDLLIRYADRTDHTFIDLAWRTPRSDQTFRPIPSELLFPPQESYEQIDVTDLARFVQIDVAPPTDVIRDRVDPAMVEVVASGLASPHGVSIAGNVVYVADTGNRRIVAVNAVTGETQTVPVGSIELVEPFDLVAQADGTLLVLDAGLGILYLIDPTLGEARPVPVAPSYAERSRGLGKGLAGEVWIANTPGQRVAAVSASGEVVREVMLPAVAGGSEMQPVDVAVTPDNSLYVTDGSAHMLYQFSEAGYLLSSQPIPRANALDGAHLAVGGDGALYMTEPEAGRVVRLDENARVDRIWNVRMEESTAAKPVGIAVAGDGTIWVVDSQGGRLLRVTPEDVK